MDDWLKRNYYPGSPELKEARDNLRNKGAHVVGEALGCRLAYFDAIREFFEEAMGEPVDVEWAGPKGFIVFWK